MQSQTTPIDQFKRRLQEILPKVQVFRNQIVESEADFLDFFKTFIKSEGVDFIENEFGIFIKLNVSEPGKPLVALKFSISAAQTKNDDIVNLITVVGIISFAKNNPALLSENLIIMVEKVTSNSEFLFENKSNDRIALVLAVDSNLLVESDCIAFKKGVLIPARYDFRIRIFSALSSDANSESAVDVIAIAAQAITGLSQVSTRKLDPLHPAHVSFSEMNTTPVQLRQEVEITGVIRALDETVGIRMKSLMESTLDAITKSNDCKYEFSFKNSEQVFQNDAEYSQVLLKYSKEILGKTKVQSLEHLNKNYARWCSFFRKFPTVIFHVRGLDSMNSPNLIPTLQLRQIDQISATATKAICWILLRF